MEEAIVNFDSAVFITFLVMNIVLGMLSSRGVTTIRGYAVGDKNFSTAAIVSTIVATWVSGEFFVTIIVETYTKGISFIGIPLLGDFLGLLLVGIFFVPRMSEFLGKLSIAEAMGDLYGKNVRIITVIASIVGVSGIIAIQLKISGLLFKYIFNIPEIYGMFISGAIITSYSSLGGIKAVTFTDIFQFGTFGAIIPTIVFFLDGGISDNQAVINTVVNSANFDYSKAFTFDNPQIYHIFSLFLWGLIPAFNPAIFQRIAMANGIAQSRSSFIISAFICLVIASLLCVIGILMLTIYPNTQQDDIFKKIIVEHEWVLGFKGLIVTGLMAMVMSTVDSYINSSSVLLVHDLREALNLKFITNELKATRVCAAIIGILGIIFSIREGSFIELFVWASMFYMPVVTVPFIMSVFGFRSSGKSVVIGMIAGFTTAMIWDSFFKIAGVAGLIPGMIANLMFLFGSHYILRQPGGWMKVEKIGADKKKVETSKFSFIELCDRNTPRNLGVVFSTGVFIVCCCLSVWGAMGGANLGEYVYIRNIILPFMFTSATILMTYPLWYESWERTKSMMLIWHMIMFIVLICFNFFAVLLSHLGEMQIATFIISCMIIVYIFKTRSALVYIVIGCVLVSYVYKGYFLAEGETINASGFGINMVYFMLVVGTALVIFLKPKHEYLKATEHRAEEFESKALKFEGEAVVFRNKAAEFANIANEFENKVVEFEHKAVEFETKAQESESKAVDLKKKADAFETRVVTLEDRVGDLENKVTYFSQKVEDQALEIERLGITAQKILNNLNHEMRVPIGDVVNFSEMLLEGLHNYTEDQLDGILKELNKDSTRLSSMILNMLDLAMLDVKKVKLKRVKVNFSNLVKERVEKCKEIYLEGKSLKFKLDVEKDVMTKIDPNYMRQVIDNLVINAIRYSENGTITVSLHKVKAGSGVGSSSAISVINSNVISSGGGAGIVSLNGKTSEEEIELVVRDEGIGIPFTEIYDIFTPFKVGTRTETPANGRGVGLALCKSAVEAHGGSIVVESDGKTGATFRVRMF